MQRKIIEMLAPADTDQAHYEAGEIYGVPSAIAERFVREGVAKYIDVELEDKPKPKKRSQSVKPWRETVRAGDVFQWQITLTLSVFDKARVAPELQGDDPDYVFATDAGIAEIGGDGKKPSPEQSSAIDFLQAHATSLYPELLEALVKNAKNFRPDWETNAPAEVDRILPKSLGSAEVEQRVAFRSIYVSERSRAGMAYIEISGDCLWDPDHGFCIVVLKDRIVAVTQPGTGWVDPEQ